MHQHQADENASQQAPDTAVAQPVPAWLDQAGSGAMLIIAALIGGALLLHRLPASIQPWLAEHVYDEAVTTRTVAIGALAAVAFALALVKQVGRERIEGAWAALRRLGPAAVLGGLWTALPAINGTLLLVYMPGIAEWIASHQTLGLLMYIAIFILSAGFGMLPTYAQAILAGFAFGVWVGIPAALVGFTGAAAVGYVVSRTVSKNRVQEEIARHPKTEAVRAALLGGSILKSFGIVALLRVPPNSPFALTNLVLSAGGAKPLPFVVGTGIGMLPRTAAAVIIGASYDTIVDAERPAWIGIAGIAATVVVLVVVGLIAKSAITHVVGEGSGQDPQNQEPDTQEPEESTSADAARAPS